MLDCKTSPRRSSRAGGAQHPQEDFLRAYPAVGSLPFTKGGMLPPYDYDFYGDLLL